MSFFLLKTEAKTWKQKWRIWKTALFHSLFCGYFWFDRSFASLKMVSFKIFIHWKHWNLSNARNVSLFTFFQVLSFEPNSLTLQVQSSKNIQINLMYYSTLTLKFSFLLLLNNFVWILRNASNTKPIWINFTYGDENEVSNRTDLIKPLSEIKFEPFDNSTRIIKLEALNNVGHLVVGVESNDIQMFTYFPNINTWFLLNFNDSSHCLPISDRSVTYFAWTSFIRMRWMWSFKSSVGSILSRGQFRFIHKSF